MNASLPREVARGVYQVGLGFVNVLLVEDDDGGLWLVDAGVERGAERIGGAIRSLGRSPGELRGVVVTHLHSDHVGGLAAVKAHTGADVWMGAEDAALVRAGRRGRELEPGPGPFRSLLVRAMGDRTLREREPVAVEHEIHDGDLLPFGAVALHTPGHTAGHVALLWRRDGGVLFAGDAATNFRAARRRPRLRGRRRGPAKPAPARRAGVRDGAVRARAAADAARLRTLPGALRRLSLSSRRPPARRVLRSAPPCAPRAAATR